jgi:transcriptional regulator with XRE-family HTH domain
MEIHDRLRQILKLQGLSISEFERTIGVGQNSVSTCLRRQSTIGHNVTTGIKEHFPHHSIDWLITGKKENNKEIISSLLAKLDEIEKEIKEIR